MKVRFFSCKAGNGVVVGILPVKPQENAEVFRVLLIYLHGGEVLVLVGMEHAGQIGCGGKRFIPDPKGDEIALPHLGGGGVVFDFGLGLTLSIR